MNDGLKEMLKKKQISAYQLSKQTGIPYTTLSELLNDKSDINKCASGMVFRLSLYFKCDMQELLNPEPLITNVSGTYNKIKYKWKLEPDSNKVELHIWDDGVEKIIDKGEYSQPRFYPYYPDMTECVIDCYLEQKKAEEMVNG